MGLQLAAFLADLERQLAVDTAPDHPLIYETPPIVLRNR
jgi:hypothetical protein